MKSFIHILLACLISTSTSFACGWYPFGEEVRFSLVNPAFFDDGGMSPYYYTFWNFGSSFQSTAENDPNVELWSQYCKNQVEKKSIYEALYELTESDISSGLAQNEMISYLKENDSEAFDYLKFAVSCSDLNESYSGWEKDSENELARSKKMLEALKRSDKVESEMIRKRYRFLALRLAFYNNDNAKLLGIYKKTFSNSQEDVIDYWALYFKVTADDASAKRNFDLAQIFIHAPGKRFGTLSRFSRKIPMDEVLSFATTDIERANIRAIYAVREKGRGLEELKKIQSLSPSHPLLDFLLVREVNKVEDWILTPRYTNFEPSMDPRGRTYNEAEEVIAERISDDENYGREVAKWLQTVSYSPRSWGLLEAYLKGITGDEKGALSILRSRKNYPEQFQELAKQLGLLLKVKNNADERLTSQDQDVLMNTRQSNYNLFLFAVSREFEFQRKLDIAAGLFSQVNKEHDYYSAGVTWKSRTGKETLGMDYYYSWFLYLDAEYSPKEIQSVINYAQKEFDKSSKFDHWQRESLLSEINKLYDLLGTKYVRENDMNSAIAAFEKVEGDLWQKYPYQTYLNANPFHADFYSGHKPSKLDTVRYTKLEIAKLYQSFLEKAKSAKTENRSYYYFLLANCELNMSHYGNSWMMRRYFWTANIQPNNLEDDDDFFRLRRARDHYKKAYELTADRQIKALCLRMMGRCEKHAIKFDAPDSWDFDYNEHGGYEHYFASRNESYKQLKKEYPEDAEELMSNCFSFERYFARFDN